MKQSSSAITRQKLLDVATDVFSETGYKTATVRDIVSRAGVNQAAINYHFRGKDALYREVMKNASEKISLFDDGASNRTDVTAEAQVRFFMEKMLTSLSDSANPDLKFIRLLSREMSEPSGVMQAPLKYHEIVMNIVRRFFPTDVPECQVAWAAFWLLGQGTVMMQASIMMEKMPHDMAKSFADSKSGLPDFLASLALNGLKNHA